MAEQGGFKFRGAVAALAVATALGACGSSHPSGSSTSTSTPRASSTTLVAASVLKKVTSNLDGVKAIPSRTRWTATPLPSASSVIAVDFLIDGKVIWIEHDPPYVFGGDDNGTNLGYLITTWLTLGSHVFTVRAVSFNGRQVSDSFTAKVTAAPEPPAALKGTWERMFTAADIAPPGVTPGGPSPVGRWEMVFDRVAAWELDPSGSGLGYQYSVQGNVIHVYAPIQETPDNGPSGGFSRYGHNHIGGNDCNWSGPFGNYRWSVSRSRLKLIPVHDGCPIRQAIWTGVWTLKSPNPPRV